MTDKNEILATINRMSNNYDKLYEKHVKIVNDYNKLNEVYGNVLEENKELKAQVEKMKNCRNCKNYLGEWFYDDFVECKYGLPEQDCEDWEMKE